jgi:hypothetical protein
MNNQVVYHCYYNGGVPLDEDRIQLEKISALDPSNCYAAFNKIYCSVKSESTPLDKKSQAEIQKNIAELYKTSLPKKYVDALNIEWQFRIMESVDSVEGSEPIIQACIEKIKLFYNVKDASWQNNLKLSYVFARFKDYKFASNLLADFVKKENTNEEVLFAYISYCAQIPELIKSHLFVTALEKAEKANHDRYCKLFGEPFLTFQVFDNPFVKDDYNKLGCSK